MFFCYHKLNAILSDLNHNQNITNFLLMNYYIHSGAYWLKQVSQSL